MNTYRYFRTQWGLVKGDDFFLSEQQLKTQRRTGVPQSNHSEKDFPDKSLQAHLRKQVVFCTKAQHMFWKSWLLGNLDNSLCKIRLRTPASKWEPATWRLQLNHSGWFWRVYSEHKDSAMVNMQEPGDSTSCKHRMGQHGLSRYGAHKQLLPELWYHPATENTIIPLLCHLNLLPFNAPLAVW